MKKPAGNPGGLSVFSFGTLNVRPAKEGKKVRG